MHLAGLFDLAGKTALVTGGNSGLGLAMARALGLAGAELILVARRQEALQRAAAQLPRQGSSGPWQVPQNYLVDRWRLRRRGRLTDGVTFRR